MSLGIRDGKRKAGRPKGAKGKGFERALLVRDYLERMEFEPIKELITILRRPNIDQMFKAEKILEMMPYVYPKLTYSQVSVESRSEETQNESADGLIEELRTMIMDKKPKDIECIGQSLPLPRDSTSSQSQLATVPSNPKLNGLNVIK